MTDQEAEAVTTALNRTDLEVQAATTPTGDMTYTITARVRALDRSDFFGPTLVFTPAANVVISSPNADQCEPSELALSCRLADFVENTGKPTRWFEVDIVARVEGAGPSTVTVTGASRGNTDGENDPDPSNNIITLELVDA